jgi:transcriptional regulator with XRE-family HTH domain
VKPTDRQLQRGIGARVRVWREQKGITQTELGRRCHVTGAAISVIENGRRAASLAMLAAICRKLNRPLHALFLPPTTRAGAPR